MGDGKQGVSGSDGIGDGDGIVRIQSPAACARDWAIRSTIENRAQGTRVGNGIAVIVWARAQPYEDGNIRRRGL